MHQDHTVNDALERVHGPFPGGQAARPILLDSSLKVTASSKKQDGASSPARKPFQVNHARAPKITA
ncbi:MAG TPA: hypothetical protein VMH81_14650 [Bryobacteraceae bacterium]|nr:hypothetical protein [Bryobacteraceae bacterium]